MEIEHVFKALADHHRRQLLDTLARTDGQTLNELCEQLPMSRYGVMKHLAILEAAGLITTKKVGRSKYHYLNAGPLQVVEAWMNPYRRLWNERLNRLEDFLRNE